MEFQKTIYLSSAESEKNSSSNTTCDYKIQLSETLYLPGEKWFCALSEIWIPSELNRYSPLYVCSDICEASYVSHTRLPVLRQLTNATVERKHASSKQALHLFPHLYYVPMRQRAVNSIHIYITDSNGHTLSVKSGMCVCALQIKQIQL